MSGAVAPEERVAEEGTAADETVEDDDSAVETATRAPRDAAVPAAALVGLAATATLFADPTGGALAFVGLAAFAVGLHRDRAGTVTVGAGLVALGVLAAGTYGAGPVPVLFAVGALTLGWELARYGRSAAVHAGTEGVRRRGIVVRAAVAAGTVLAVTVAVGGAYAVGATGRPVAAVVLFVLGATLVGTAATARER